MIEEEIVEKLRLGTLVRRLAVYARVVGELLLLLLLSSGASGRD